MPNAAPHVLLIDDDAAVLAMVGEALTHYGMKVHSFLEANRAMQLLDSPDSPDFDLVISDINMTGMDGFDVIHKIKGIKPNLPVVLMTGEATLDYAIRAMRMGAANLFQKPLTIRELVNSVFHLVEMHRDFRLADAGLRGLVHETRHFSFRSAELDIASMVRHLTDRLVPLGFAQPSNVDVLAMAFHEALINALEHGSLELDSNLKEDFFSSKDAWQAQYQERISNEKYSSRRIDVKVDTTHDHYIVEITDEGPGFDTSRISRVPDVSARKSFGRGLSMIHMVMDEVTHNELGNQIRMVLRRKEGHTRER